MMEEQATYTSSHICKIFSSHLAKVRIILPTSLRDGFKHIQDIKFNPTILKTIKSLCTQVNLNTARIKKEAINILCFDLLETCAHAHPSLEPKLYLDL